MMFLSLVFVAVAVFFVSVFVLVKFSSLFCVASFFLQEHFSAAQSSLGLQIELTGKVLTVNNFNLI